MYCCITWSYWAGDTCQEGEGKWLGEFLSHRIFYDPSHAVIVHLPAKEHKVGIRAGVRNWTGFSTFPRRNWRHRGFPKFTEEPVEGTESENTKKRQIVSIVMRKFYLFIFFFWRGGGLCPMEPSTSTDQDCLQWCETRWKQTWAHLSPAKADILSIAKSGK